MVTARFVDLPNPKGPGIIGHVVMDTSGARFPLAHRAPDFHSLLSRANKLRRLPSVRHGEAGCGPNLKIKWVLILRPLALAIRSNRQRRYLNSTGEPHPA